MKFILKKNIGNVILSIIFSLFSSLFLSIIPLTTKYLIENYINLTQNIIIILVSIYISSILLFLLFEYLKKMQSARFQKNVNLEVKRELTNKFFEFAHYDLNEKENGDYANILTHDIDVVYSKYFEVVLNIFITVTSFITYFVIMLFVDWILALTSGVACFITLIIPKIIGNKISSCEVETSQEEGEYINKIIENFDGKACINNKTRNAFFQNIDSQNLKLENSVFDLNKEYYKSHIVSGFSLYLINIISFIVGVIFIMLGISTVGAFVAIIAYIDCIAIPTRDFIYEVITIKGSKGIRDKLELILNYKTESLNSINSFENLEIKKLSFSYDDVQVFNSFSYNIEKGKKYVVTGKNGSGKSTLIKLISRELKVDDNMISVNSIDINSVDFSSFGFYVSIDNSIFEGSLVDNITLFNSYENITDEYLQKLKINHLIDKYIEPHGTNLSSGEIGKIQILRALNSNKDLLVFDEIFANIDQQSEIELTNFLLSLNKTIILISHNLDKENIDKFDYQISLS